ncbi:MAG TPA: adenylate/guanylate cyclase domain-containing protein [Casimicrobiaceae bacterium]|nr:adenylate/guanylate cyclase domain-containing protein [Casimicrobiaceae bacterium]
MQSHLATRRLAAIVIADVVGYTRLMELDDTGTFSRLGSIRNEVIDPAIVSHGGHIVQTAGDGWLAEFPSALAALRASIQIQREMAKRNAGSPPNELIEYRMGINLGDIMVQGTEIAGDGVNVASRLESMADPGAICVSSAVREQVHGQLDAELVDIGDQQVKNIARPIRAYRVVIARDRTGKKSTSTTVRRKAIASRGWVLIASTLVVIALSALLAEKWWARPPSSSAPALSIAILPFATASGAPDEARFANALTEDVTTTLGQWRWARVSAHGLVAGYTGKSVDARAIGRQLNVRYVVEGDVRRQPDQFIVATHMIDVATGAQAWSDGLKFATAQGPPVPHLQMAKRMRAALMDTEIRRATKERPTSDPMDLVLRGRGILGSSANPSAAVAKARPLFDDALRAHPQFVPALYGLLQTYDMVLEETATPNRAAILSEADRVTSQMIGIDRNDDSVWRARASVLQWLGRFDEAMVADERAQALDPTNTNVVLDRAWILIQTGRSADALPLIAQAIAMDPLEQSWPYHFMCKAYVFLGRYGDAVAACERAATENDWWLNQVYLCAAYAQHGDIAKAIRSKNALLKQQPDYTIDRYRRTYAASSPTFLEQVEQHLAAGLREAGLPEH